jgi:hypothetical protein
MELTATEALALYKHLCADKRMETPPDMNTPQDMNTLEEIKHKLRASLTLPLQGFAVATTGFEFTQTVSIPAHA